MAGYSGGGGKGGGGYAGAGMGASPGYNGAIGGSPGGSYPLALMGGAGNPGGAMYNGAGQMGMRPYGPGGKIGSGMQPYNPMAGAAGNPMASYQANGGVGDMNIAILVQNATTGAYAAFVMGADGSMGMSGPGGSFMYRPNSAMQGIGGMQAGGARYGDSIDNLLTSGRSGGYRDMSMGGYGLPGPGVAGGYDPLKKQMPDLKDVAKADYMMRDPNYANSRMPAGGTGDGRSLDLRSDLMTKDPKSRYNQMVKDGGSASDNYTNPGSKPKRDANSEIRQAMSQQQLSSLERKVAVPEMGYSGLPLAV